ncbi:hypothetical protein C9374_010793 [Naegleria lovaniensis]|uniref:Amidase domain-containing protein n=1 Tax=Naegleria lovaniensis TaxID=51637 RepID=A0AA88KFG1_NAELO|nr:uncharacterized protein C9374_010793 [Naegleria lovaniensis]KAG2374509.1 hypothetical protein C9374_010793 [Naegleria lovaniensis]
MLWTIVALGVAAFLGYHAYDTFVGRKRIPIKEILQRRTYELRSVEAPKLTGSLFWLFVTLLEYAPLGDWIVPLILKSSNFSLLDELSLYNAPKLYPIPERNEQDQLKDLQFAQEHAGMSVQEIQKKEIERILNEYYSSSESSNNNGEENTKPIWKNLTQFHRLYKERKTTPLKVAQNILEAIKKGDSRQPPLLAVIKYDADLFLKQAKESTERFENGTEISVFDGIPVTIKDELDLAGFTSSKGMKVTEYSNHVITLEEESNICKSLRALGAIFVGKANQNEIGICPRGMNLNFGSARNPFNMKCDTGGSSSGGGACVASGLVPLSIGTDGGGSIRVPASFCGLYGLKPTHFRVSTYQHSAPVAFSTCVAGPLTSSAIDLTLSFAAIAGRRENDSFSWSQPRDLRLSEIRLADKEYYSLEGQKIGIDNAYFNDVKDQRIVKMCRDFIENVFCKVYGAQVDDSIFTPLLEPSRVSHLVCIASEMRNGMKDYGYFEYSKRSLLCPETRMSLLSQKYISSSQFISAQRIRSHQMEEFDKIFQNVNVYATPTIAGVTPEFVDEQVMKGGYGVSDYDVLSQIMKFIFISNFCGYPSITIPIGFVDGKPVGLQLMAKHWDEVTLLKYALLAEKYTEKKKPEMLFEIL